MKKLALLSLLTACSIMSRAQFPEDFNIKCATATVPGYGWMIYNPIPSTFASGSWKCGPTGGRPVTASGSPTPGLLCSGYYSSANHLDTSYFISPAMLFTATNYPDGKVYLRFDTKKDNILNGAKITIITPTDTIPQVIDTTTSSLTVLPDFGSADASDWVTHEVNLSYYIGKPAFYIAFRYTSDVTTGTIWYLDNLRLTTNSLAVSDAETAKHMLPITILGASTSSRIELSYTALSAGKYHIFIYDMMGRSVYNGEVDTRVGTASYTIDGLSLRPGMYCVKMGNENTYGTTKLMIQ